MESAQATTADTRAERAALDTYQGLTAEQVIADLPRLGVDELLLVESLEQAGEARAEILDRIDDLLSVGVPAVGQLDPAAGFDDGYADEDEYEYDDFDGGEDDDLPLPVAPAVAAAAAAPVAAAPVAAPAAPAAAPQASLSVDLLDQMGGLLERAAARMGDPVVPSAVAAVAAAPVSAVAAGPAAAPVLPAPVPPFPEVISPRRRGRKVLRSLKVILGLVVVAAVVAAGAMFIGQRTTSSTGAGSSPPVPSANATGDPLAAKVVAGVAGFVLQVDPTGATGPADLAAATKDDGGSDAQQALTKDGFVHGYQRVWTNTPLRHIVVTVYQFGDAAGATAYAQRRIGADRAALKGSSADFPVPAVPGVTGVSSTSAGGASSAVFARDVYVARVTVILPTQAGEAAMVQQLAARQYALL